MEPITYDFSSVPTILAFVQDRSFIKGLMGPIGCLSADHEVLTRQRWVRMDEWQGQEILVSTAEGITHFEQPLRYIKEPCEWFYHFSSRGIDQMVSPEHQILYTKKYDKPARYVKSAEEIAYAHQALKSGWAGLIPTSFSPPEDGCFFVNEISSDEFAGLSNITKVTSPDGYKYCFTTSTGFFVTRHNNKIAVTGNSGKSSGCVMELWLSALAQQPNSEGIRYTRFAIVRNTYQQLKDTTLKTVLEWIRFGVWKESDHSLLVKQPLEDGTTIHSEWLFRALDRPDQVSNLLSLELTRAWMNEAKELPKEVFDQIQGRLDRFPKRNGSYGVTYPALVLDTNPPSYDHWWYRVFEESDLEETRVFKQPSARSEHAENLPNLSDKYYKRQVRGKDPAWVRVYVDGQYGFLREGRPVHPQYNDTYHVFKEPIEPVAALPLLIGMDFGRTPAAVLTQLNPYGKLLVLDEIVTENMDIRGMIEQYLKPLLATKYRGMRVKIVGDMSGKEKSQVDSRTVFHEITAQGFNDIEPSHTNSLGARIMALNLFLTRTSRGESSFLLSPTCSVLRRALIGGYKYRQLQISGGRVADVPDKNMYSHIAEALQYAAMAHESGYAALQDGGASGKDGLLNSGPLTSGDVPTGAWT